MNEGSSRTRTVESDGITATKTVDAAADGATVTLEASSTRSEPAVIQLLDPALEAVSGDRIEVLDRDGGVARPPGDSPPGFERELGSGEAWTVSYRVTAPLPEGLEADPAVSLSDADGIEALLDRSRSDRLSGVRLRGSRVASGRPIGGRRWPGRNIRIGGRRSGRPGRSDRPNAARRTPGRKRRPRNEDRTPRRVTARPEPRTAAQTPPA